MSPPISVVRDALAAVYSGASLGDAEALLDQLEERGLRLVCRDNRDQESLDFGGVA
jgi:hypothetical protein